MKQLTDQEVFDKVATHLFNQGEQAYDKERDMCAYRIKKGDKTLSCAVGCLIPDNEYNKDFEGSIVIALVRNTYGGIEFSEDLTGFMVPHLSLLSTLQVVHDSFNWDNERTLKHALEGAARQHNLSSNILANLHFPSEAV